LSLNHTFVLLAVVEVIDEAVLIADAVVVGAVESAGVLAGALTATVRDALQAGVAARHAITARLAEEGVHRTDE
jgi:hypothetical protein